MSSRIWTRIPSVEESRARYGIHESHSHCACMCICVTFKPGENFFRMFRDDLTRGTYLLRARAGPLILTLTYNTNRRDEVYK